LLLGANGIAIRARIMSVGWMVFVAGLIAAEKTLPGRVATYGTAAILLVLGLLLLVAPAAIPASRSRGIAMPMPQAGQMGM
jgi:hypothetical protein